MILISANRMGQPGQGSEEGNFSHSNIVRCGRKDRHEFFEAKRLMRQAATAVEGNRGGRGILQQKRVAIRDPIAPNPNPPAKEASGKAE